MISIEKSVTSRSLSNEFRSPIGLVVYAQNEPNEELWLELNPFDFEASTIRLVDETGKLIIQEAHRFDPSSDRLIFTVKNLKAGTYFFEVNDGFFYQIKELHIPPQN